MRPGSSPELLAALQAAGVTSFLLGSLDFKSETVNIWTGGHEFTVNDTGDTFLNGKTFSPMAHGVILNMGDNAFSMNGSEALEISLAVPASPSQAISAAMVYPDEYQTRLATLWRAVMIEQPGLGTPAKWFIRRVRTGTMDKIEIQNDGQSHLFKLSLEGFAGTISSATNSSYMDQKRFDPNDASQDFVAACANGDPAPSKSLSSGFNKIAEGFATGQYGSRMNAQ